jgi:predicted nucleic acid-binding Zn finger protein
VPEDERKEHQGGTLEALREALRSAYESPPASAASAAGELRVVKIAEAPAETWIVMGNTADYVVVRGLFCSCPHFIIRVVGLQNPAPCYHMVAVEIAARTRRYHDLTHTLTPEERLGIILDALAGAKSAQLRRVLYRLGGGSKQ